jgi:hypothetical protein
MTTQKHAKARVRARMARTGERYATARSHVMREASGNAAAAATPTRPSTRQHAAGTNAGAAALRTLLAAAGAPVSEPVALVLGGGIGLGVFQFHYAAEDVATFFLAGRHRWDDDQAFLSEGLRRAGCEPLVTETTSATRADRQLREALAAGEPVVAWLDFAELGTRAYPASYSGGGYHVVVVRDIDDARGVAHIDDLADGPLAVPLEDLARARGRIAKDRHRLLRRAPGARAEVTPAALGAGLQATVDGFASPRTRSFGLQALDDLAARLRGEGKGSWSTVFARGGQLLDALLAVHDGIELQGSGGGLVRTPFAAGLREAAALGADPAALAEVAATYEALGARWTALAAQVLPSEVPALRRARELSTQRALAYRTRGMAARAALESSWAEQAALRAEVDDCFPLDAPQRRAFLDAIASTVTALHAGEREALEQLQAALR